MSLAALEGVQAGGAEAAAAWGGAVGVEAMAQAVLAQGDAELQLGGLGGGQDAHSAGVLYALESTI